MYNFENEMRAIHQLAIKEYSISNEEARILIKSLARLFREHCLYQGIDKRSITKITTKFRDAGRRSAPWKAASSRVPGRPQDGSDGNRINRWLLPTDHKFYADEIAATLVECKYILQTMSMIEFPPLSNDILKNSFNWLLNHELTPGMYKDPIQLVNISFIRFLQNPRSLQSGHFIPLDRGGIHYPTNTFLMLFRSNQIQGNLTLEELLEFMESTLARHQAQNNRDVEIKDVGISSL